MTLPDPLLNPAPPTEVSVRFEIKKKEKSCQSHTQRRGCDDLSRLVSLLIHLAPSNAHPLTEVDISCLHRDLAECDKDIYSTFLEVRCYLTQCEDLWAPLFPVIIHQCADICVFDGLFAAVRHSSPCIIYPSFHFHFGPTLM